MKIVTILGARPQFIKAASVSKAIQDYNFNNSDDQITEIIVHTGQHYDDNMSAVFFQELNIPKPQVNLSVGSGSHGWQTAQMLIRIEEILVKQKPDWVMVYGDTNSTLASALAAIKLHIPVAHVESGLRSYNREMPEEHNRVLVDHCSDILFCPTQTAVDNLSKEGIFHGVKLVGDTMYDATLQFTSIARKKSTIMVDLGLKSKSYFLATMHRPYNTDIPENLLNILKAFSDIRKPVVFAVHPRTKKKIAELNGSDRLIKGMKNIVLIDPVGYLDMLILEENAYMILTDSGGMQKEAYFMGIPCVTLRPETEWVETIEAGWNVVVGAHRDKIINAAALLTPPKEKLNLYGDGKAAEKILASFLQLLEIKKLKEL
jgi:UDP-N-acetylglucosamine 2-epimerase